MDKCSSCRTALFPFSPRQVRIAMVFVWLSRWAREAAADCCELERINLVVTIATTFSTELRATLDRPQTRQVCNLSATIPAMMTDPATAIKREVLQLIELQIETLRREGCLTDFDLKQYNARSGEITRLYQELDRIGRMRFDLQSARAS
jgi:hypothetical protein